MDVLMGLVIAVGLAGIGVGLALVVAGALGRGRSLRRNGALCAAFGALCLIAGTAYGIPKSTTDRSSGVPVTDIAGSDTALPTALEPSFTPDVGNEPEQQGGVSQAEGGSEPRGESQAVGQLRGARPNLDGLSRPDAAVKLAEWVLSSNTKKDPGVVCYREQDGCIIHAEWYPRVYGEGQGGLVPVAQPLLELYRELYRKWEGVRQLHVLVLFDTDSVQGWTGLNFSLGAVHAKQVPEKLLDDPMGFLSWVRGIAADPQFDEPTTRKTWLAGALAEVL